MLPHPRLSRQEVLRIGGLGLIGAGLPDLLRREAGAESPGTRIKARSVIYLFQSGGPAQHETWDLKPDAPSAVRGEFRPIATVSPGMEICEHLPRLAARSNRFALLRSFTHTSNHHTVAHHIMLTGEPTAPPGFDANRPTSSD